MNEYITMKTAMRISGYSRYYVYAIARHDGAVESIRDGKRILYSKALLDALADPNRRKAAWQRNKDALADKSRVLTASLESALPKSPRDHWLVAVKAAVPDGWSVEADTVWRDGVLDVRGVIIARKAVP